VSATRFRLYRGLAAPFSHSRTAHLLTPSLRAVSGTLPTRSTSALMRSGVHWFTHTLPRAA
jgi:hypothetical protein